MNFSANDLATQVSFERPTQDYESKARIMGEHVGGNIENRSYIARKEKEIFMHASVL